MGYEGMIGPSGLPLSHTLTVQSGASSCLAMAHKISIYDKKSKLTNSMTPVTPQAVADELQWLEIDFDSEKDWPFTPYVNGLEVYGKYNVYDSEFNELSFLEPSGMKPQTNIFHDAGPGQYIIELETNFETDDSTFICQYFFGVTIPKKTPDGSATTATSSSENEADPLSGYLYVVDYLWTEQNFTRRQLQYLAIDTTQLVGLSAAVRARLFSGLEKYNVQVLDKTEDELIDEGYIEDSGGMNTFGMLDFDITWNDSSWSVTRTDITAIS